MNLRQWIMDNGLAGKAIEHCESKKSTYDGTDEKIQFLQLPMEVEGQDYLVLSHTLSQKVKAGTLNILDAHVTHTDYGYGLVCPPDITVLATITV